MALSPSGRIRINVTGARGVVTPGLQGLADKSEAYASALAAPIAATRFSFISAASNNALLFTAFRSDAHQVADLFTAFDPINLTRITDTNTPAFTAPEGDTAVPARGVRDPAPVFWAGYWYVFYTPGFNTSDIGIERTQNFVDWEFVGNLPYVTSAQPNTKLAWAPRPFIDPTTGSLWLETALSDNIDGTQPTHYMTVRRLTGAAPTANPADWANPVNLGLGFNYIDGATYVENGRYFHFVKNETTKYIERFESATYPNSGGWVKTGAGNWAGIQGQPDGNGRASTPFEAPRLVYFQNSWRMYLDPFNGSTYFVSSGASLSGNTWSAPQQLNVGGKPIRHFNPILINTDALKYLVADAIGGIAAKSLLTVKAQSAQFLLDGSTSRDAQIITAYVTGAPINGTFARYRAGANHAIFQDRYQSDFGKGHDLIVDQTNGFISLASIMGGVATDGLKVFVGGSLNGKIDAPQGFAPLPPVAITDFVNGWGGGSLAPQCVVTRAGIVQITGNITKSGTRNQFEKMFTLPVGCRPPRLQLLGVKASDTQPATIAVFPNGDVQWGNGDGIITLDDAMFISAIVVA